METTPEENEVNDNQDTNNESIVEYINGKGLTDNNVTFRPFTPPFAQLQSFTAKQNMVSTLKKMQKENVDFEDIHEVEGEEEDKLELVYDSILKCYYEPKSGNYYQFDKN